MKDAKARRQSSRGGQDQWAFSRRILEQIVACNTNVAIGSASVVSTQYMSFCVLYAPAGVKNLRLLFPGVRIATNAETALTGASPMNVAVAVVPNPWSPTRSYAAGDQVTWNMTQSSGKAGNPIYTCVTPNTGSEPGPGNANWSMGAAITRTQATRNGVQACGARTAILSDGSTVNTEGLWSTDPIAVPGADAGPCFIGVWCWVQNGGGIAWCNGNGFASGSFFASGATTPDLTSAGYASSPSQFGSSTVIRPALALGVPAIPDSGKSVIIVGDSIAAGTDCGSSVNSMSIVSGGTGYTAADEGKLFLIDNTGATATSISVPAVGIITQVAAGAVSAVRVWHPGSYANTGLPTGTQGMTNYTAAVAALLGGQANTLTGSGLTVSVTTTAGGFDQTVDTYAQGFLQRGLSAAGIRWAACASPGDTVAGWITRRRTRNAIIAAARPSSLICELGINDITAGDSFATISARLSTLYREWRSLGIAVYQTTILPFPTSTDGWATLGNQTAGAQDSVRQQLNTWIRGGAGGLLTGFIEAAGAIEDGGTSAPTGKCIVNGTVGYVFIDGKHPTPPILPTLAAVVRNAAQTLV